MNQQISDETANMLPWRDNVQLGEPRNYCNPQELFTGPSDLVTALLLGDAYQDPDLFVELDEVIQGIQQRANPHWSDESEHLAKEALERIETRTQTDISDWAQHLADSVSSFND